MNTRVKILANIDYTRAYQQGQHVVVEGLQHFHLAQTLDCGQAFRWQATGDNAYTGIAHGRRLELALSDAGLTLYDTSLEDFENIWQGYFDLGRSYATLRGELAACDKLQDALEFSPGLRLLVQDKWEMLISFILSQNSNIPRIKKMISTLCEHFGDLLPCGGYTFPTAPQLAKLNQADLTPVRLGYRSAYILDAARRVTSGKLCLTSAAAMPTPQLRDELLAIHGVGPKVADCVLLFGFNRLECFPLDVWMKRVMATLYPNGFPLEFASVAGIAQQFLFHHARNS